MRERDARIETYVALVSAATAILLGALGLAGWAFGLPVLTRVGPAYQPIALSVAGALILLGLLLALMASGRVRGRARLAAAVVAGLVSLHGLLEVVGFLVGADLNREDALMRYLAKAWSRPLNSMSPAAGALMLLLGASLLTLLLGVGARRASLGERLRSAAGGLGAMAAAGGLVLTLGYLYGAPLLSGGDVIPMSATGAVGFLLLGIGATAAAGADRWPLRVFAGPSVRAQLLRAFVPLIVFAILVSTAAYERVPVFMHLNRVIQASLLAVAFAVAASLVVYRVAGAIAGAIERAQGAVRESEAHYRLLHETMLQGVIYRDREGRIISMNPAAVRILGRTPEDLLGETPMSMEHDTIRQDGTPFPGLEHPAMVALRTGQQVQEVVMGVYNPREQGYRWVNVHAVPILQEGQTTPDQVYTIFDDITERLRAEEALAYALQLSSAHMNNSPLAVVEFDSQLRVVRWSEEAERMFGWTAEEAIGKAIPELRWVYEEDVELVRQESAGLMSGERPRSLSVNRNYRKDGSVINCEWYNSAIYDAQGKLVSVLSLVLDVTERTRAEEALRESEERYHGLFETMQEGFFLAEVICDESGQPVDYRYLEANPALEPLTGRERGNVIGRTAREVLPGLEDYWIQTYGRVALTGEPARIEQFAAPLGRYYQTAAYSPRPGQVAVLFSDVTERKRAEEERERLAETMNAEIDHRMKNNLAMIAALLQMQLSSSAAAGVSAPDQLRQAIARINSLAAVHEQLYEARSARIEMVSMLRRVGEAAVQALSAADIDLSVSGDALPVVSKEGSTLAILANELITNAVKYGGWDADGKRRVRIIVSREGGWVRISIWNSGNPIPEGFDPAAQSGLGLRLTREAVAGQWQGEFSLRASDGGTMVEILADAGVLTESGEE